ncbi:acyl-CoA desaturase [Robiginitomaculum antarcticum]|uniref:acyl-CoA desaturase n=1 Tax=Robiginitomaculum antarcticum TaxID=437507 RepID=UPI000369D5F9|nr:acyl-CoA desaturase [Robiginitomaculum antarcticum]
MRDITDRVVARPDSNCAVGHVRFDVVKSLWWTSMMAGGIIGIIYFTTWTNVAVFLGLSAVILCGGHSLGMHRKLIHDSFDCPLWLERFGVYLGTLVGLGGPFTIMKTHDLRDWAQRQSACHAYLRHGRAMTIDYFWQVHCRLDLERAPDFRFPKKIIEDPFLVFIQRTAMAQQIPLAIILFFIGGWGCVLWGICLRVSISIFGHWLIGYFAHNHGPRDFHNVGAAVQGHNVPFCGLFTFGECWHNNHHAFPESAKLGLMPGQSDPGWWVLKQLRDIGLVWNINLPDISSRKA